MSTLRVYSLRGRPSPEWLRQCLHALAFAIISEIPDSEREHWTLMMDHVALADGMRCVIGDMDAGLALLEIDMDDPPVPRVVREQHSIGPDPDYPATPSIEIEGLVRSVARQITDGTLQRMLEMGGPVGRVDSGELVFWAGCPACGCPKAFEVTEEAVLAGRAECPACGAAANYRICPFCYHLSLGLPGPYTCLACARQVVLPQDPPLHSLANMVSAAVSKAQSLIVASGLDSCQDDSVAELLGHIGNLAADQFRLLQEMESLKTRLKHRATSRILSLGLFEGADDLFLDVFQVRRSVFAHLSRDARARLVRDRVERLSHSSDAIVALVLAADSLVRQWERQRIDAEKESIRSEVLAELGLATVESIKAQVRGLRDKAKAEVERVELAYRSTVFRVLGVLHPDAAVALLKAALPENGHIQSLPDDADVDAAGDALYLSDIWLVLRAYWCELAPRCLRDDCTKRQLGPEFDRLNAMRNTLLHHKSSVDEVLLCRIVAVCNDLMDKLAPVD